MCPAIRGARGNLLGTPELSTLAGHTAHLLSTLHTCWAHQSTLAGQPPPGAAQPRQAHAAQMLLPCHHNTFYFFLLHLHLHFCMFAISQFDKRQCPKHNQISKMSNSNLLHRVNSRTNFYPLQKYPMSGLIMCIRIPGHSSCCC